MRLTVPARRVSDASMAQVRSVAPNVLGLISIRIHGTPYAIKPHNVTVWFKITRPGDETFKYSSRQSIKPARFSDPTDAIVFSMPDDKKVALTEDLKVEFFHGSTMFKKVCPLPPPFLCPAARPGSLHCPAVVLMWQTLFHFWFNTRFISFDAQNPRNCRLLLTKVFHVLCIEQFCSDVQ